MSLHKTWEKDYKQKSRNKQFACMTVDHQKRLLVKILRLDSLRMSGGVEDLSEMAQGSSWLREK